MARGNRGPRKRPAKRKRLGNRQIGTDHYRPAGQSGRRERDRRAHTNQFIQRKAMR